MMKVNKLLLSGLLFAPTLHASFIESTLGAAVVNDSTATYYNPAALTLLSENQFIALGSIARSTSSFTGQSIQAKTGFIQFGSSESQTNFYLPSLYLGIPTNNRLTLGLAVVSNFFNRDVEDHKVLRYVQPNNTTRDIEIVSALGFKLNEQLSVGAGLALSQARMTSEPVSRFPSAQIPDAQSHNESDGSGVGGDLGILFKPKSATVIGLNYRSAVTYHLKGRSILESTPVVFSNHYAYTYWTPAREVLSISHSINPSLGFIATVQRIQWSIFKEVSIQGIASKIGTQPVILDARVPHFFRDVWLFTVGGNYRINPKAVIRIAANYNQSPGNPHYQISNGDGVILGASMGYKLNQYLSIDASYAHSFIQDQTVDIQSGANLINGLNKAANDAVSLKLLFSK